MSSLLRVCAALAGFLGVSCESVWPFKSQPENTSCAPCWAPFSCTPRLTALCVFPRAFLTEGVAKNSCILRGSSWDVEVAGGLEVESHLPGTDLLCIAPLIVSPALGRFCPTPTSANTFCFSHVGATCFRAQRNGFERGHFPCGGPGIFPKPVRTTRRCAAARGKRLRAARAEGGRGVGAAGTGPRASPRAEARAAVPPDLTPGQRRWRDAARGAVPQTSPGRASGERRRGERAPFAARGAAAAARRL